jgi:hypothetical protein
MKQYTEIHKIEQAYSKHIINKMISMPNHHPYFIITIFGLKGLNDQGGALKSNYQLDQIWKQYEYVYNRICSNITKYTLKKSRHSLGRL